MLGIEHGSGKKASSYDVAIVGAGPAGSAIAAALAELGWHVLLVEREESPRHKVCGEFISPDAQSTLRSLGLYEAVTSLRPLPLHAVEITSRHVRRLHRPLPGEAWGLSRYAFDAGLANAAIARGVELRTTTTVTRHLAQDEHIELHLQNREASTQVYARTAIMAYGRVPLPGLSAKPTTPGLAENARFIGAKCHYTGVNMEKQVGLYFFPGGYAGLNPIEGGHANLCVLASYDAFARAGRSIGGILAAAQAGNPALAERMAGAEALVDTECAVAPVDTHRHPQPWAKVAQLGDSAVMLPPLCGDGMAMALQSARLCAPLADDYLRGRISLPAWEKVYRQAWSQEFGRRVWLGRRLQQLLQIPSIAEAMLLTGTLFPALADYFIASTRGKVATASTSPA